MATPRSAGLGWHFIVGVAGFALAGVIVLVWFKCWTPRVESYEQKRGSVRMTKANEIRKDAHQKLYGYAWVDQKAGVVKIPIDRAMELAAGDLKGKKAGASEIKVEVPYPVGLSAPAPTPAAAPGDKAAPAPSAKPAPPAAPAPSAKPPVEPSNPPKATPTSSPAPGTPISSERKSSDLKK